MKKWKLFALIGGLAVVGYGVYARLTLEPIPIGELCTSSGGCPGECLGFGDLLPDYSHKEICTKPCSAPSDCPAPTTCESIQVVSTDGKSVKTENKGYCMPAAPPAADPGGAQ